MCNLVECEWLLVFNFFVFGKIGLWDINFILGLRLFGMKGKFLGILIVEVFLNNCLVKWFFSEWKVIIEILLFRVNIFIVCWICWF